MAMASSEHYEGGSLLSWPDNEHAAVSRGSYYYESFRYTAAIYFYFSTDRNPQRYIHQISYRHIFA